MRQFIREIAYDGVNFTKLVELFTWMESKEEAKIQEAIDFITGQEAYLPLLERRYLNFIKARLKDSTATLADIQKVVISDKVQNAILEMGDNCWQFEPLAGTEAFSVMVDFCGSMIHSNVDLEKYLEHHTEYLLREGDYDCSNFALGNLARCLEDYIDPDLYTGGWFGKILHKVANAKLGKIAFDHVDCRVSNDALFLSDFLLYVQGYMDSDELEWDFFQSYPLVFPSTVYALQYNWKYICKAEEFVIPDDYNEAFTRSGSSIWLVEP